MDKENVSSHKKAGEGFNPLCPHGPQHKEASFGMVATRQRQYTLHTEHCTAPPTFKSSSFNSEMPPTKIFLRQKREGVSATGC